VVIVPTPCR